MTDVAMAVEELEAIKRRYEAATPGPWILSVEGRDHSSGSDFIVTASKSRRDDIDLSATKPDQEFIAHAREDIPRLVAEVERLRQLLREQKISF